MIAAIATMIVEARINSLIRKREIALRKKDYDRVWKINMAIDRNVCRLGGLTYFKIWV